MKNVFLVLLFVIAFAGCEKEDPVVVDNSIVGLFYSGYSFTSTFSGSKMYDGYEFVTGDSCYDLLLEEDARVVSRVKRAYSLDYPMIKIYDKNAAAGYWVGTFKGDILEIKSLILKKR